MARQSQTWQDFAAETLGTVLATLLALITGLVGAVVLAWATGSLFRIVLAPGSTDLRAALTAVAALFVVGAGVFLVIAIGQKASDIHHRRRERERHSQRVAPASDQTTGR